jgi:sulfatase modifying factor 1
MFSTRARGVCERRPRPRNPAAQAVVMAAAAIALASLGMLAVRIDARGVPAQPPPDAVTLDGLLERAGAYVLSFEEHFSNVVTEERYIQEADSASNVNMVIPTRRGGFGSTVSTPSIQRRELVSDFLLVKLPGNNEWLPFRDVFEVDRQRVRDREDRLTKLLVHPAGTDFDQALRIMDESARYNIGDVQRTINLPVLALVVLRPEVQQQFRFSLGKLETSVGANVYTVEYHELASPTLVHGASGRDLFCHGRFWIDASTGRVMKSEFIVNDVLVGATVTTRYQVDQNYGVAVPVDMKEEYSLANQSRVTGVATYGRFRRFGVQVADEIAKPPRTITDAVTGMTLVEIPSGPFTMGSPSSEAGRGADETAHEVTISRPFFLGQYEVTDEQWRKVMSTSPSQFASCGLTCPVERVSYDDVQQFLDGLNARVTDVHFRLPTEAEWECACRAGSASPFTTGANITTEQANFNGTHPYASFPPGVFRGQPTPTGTFDANVWGIGDMHGNVREWTSDWYAPYPRGAARDPRGPVSGTTRVVRGGSWLSDANGVRCAAREPHAPTERQGTIGFRVAADLTGQ